jgi:hypothetical protein
MIPNKIQLEDLEIFQLVVVWKIFHTMLRGLQLLE